MTEMGTIRELTFAADGGRWTADYKSDGDTLVQLSRSGIGGLTAYAWLDGMPPVAVRSWGAFGSQQMLVRLALPAGVNVRLTSESRVTQAKAMVVAQSSSSGGGGITVDRQLSLDSDNAVANSTVTAALLETVEWNESGGKQQNTTN